MLNNVMKTGGLIMFLPQQLIAKLNAKRFTPIFYIFIWIKLKVKLEVEFLALYSNAKDQSKKFPAGLPGVITRSQKLMS